MKLASYLFGVVTLLGLNSGVAFGAEITLKDCDNLSNELYYGQPYLDLNDHGSYKRKMDKCDSLRAAVKCDNDSRAERSEAIFYIVNRKTQINVELADLVTAEMICSRSR